MNKVADASIRKLIEDATRTITSDTSRLDAEVLLASVLKKDRSHLHAWPEKILAEEACKQFHRLVTRRMAGEPVAYLTGQREFWSLPLVVSTDTLIPRPETETLVRLALEKIPVNSSLKVADLGTGSGAIALAVASERPRCQLIATDVSERALAIAAGNAKRLGIENISFIQGSWCDPLPRTPFDIVISNPPYIKDQDKHLQQGDVRFEPRSALAAGPNGMRDLNHIAACAHDYLRDQGWLILEHGFNQADLVKKQLSGHGYTDIASHKDEAGIDRVCMGSK